MRRLCGTHWPNVREFSASLRELTWTSAECARLREPNRVSLGRLPATHTICAEPRSSVQAFRLRTCTSATALGGGMVVLGWPCGLEVLNETVTLWTCSSLRC